MARLSDANTRRSLEFELIQTTSSGYVSRATVSFFLLLGTLRYGDYGLRTTDGRHFRAGTRHMCSVVPTVASSRRCVVEGFHVVQRGVVRGTEDGMKK